MNRREVIKTAVSCILYGCTSKRDGLVDTLFGRTDTPYTTAPMYGHSLTNRSYLPNEDAPKGNVGVSWNFEAGDWVISSPVVHDGRLYFGSFDDTVYCLNAETGKKVWEYETDGGVGTTPCVTDDAVFFGNHSGEVVRLSSDDGDEIWKRDMGDYWIRSSPKYSNGLLYVAEYMKERGEPQNLNGSIHALNAQTGDTVWSVQTDDAFYSSPAIDDGVLYVGGLFKGVLRAISAVTGEVLWEYQAESQIAGSPSVTRNRIYFGDHDGLVCLGKDGNELWKTESDDVSGVSTTTAVSDDYVFFGDSDGNIFSYDRITSKRSWKRESDFRFYAGGMSATDDALLVANHGGEVWSFKSGTGETNWKYCLDTGIRTIPAVKDGTVYFGTHDDGRRGDLYALRHDEYSEDDGNGCEGHEPSEYPHDRYVSR